ncbi:hypothetical protein EV421DRAFT_1742526 [Armillaria borealis]|uniref:Uncharacterized protein n=1 Tax=Armillaria borealis TaxID=47425 RepID=A0AA39IXA2_9AGAR|nr:hypothetical protein EV421DRAFT_1742526 [Armillaria borealis]
MALAFHQQTPYTSTSGIIKLSFRQRDCGGRVEEERAEERLPELSNEGGEPTKPSGHGVGFDITFNREIGVEPLVLTGSDSAPHSLQTRSQRPRTIANVHYPLRWRRTFAIPQQHTGTSVPSHASYFVSVDTLVSRCFLLSISRKHSNDATQLRGLGTFTRGRKLGDSEIIKRLGDSEISNVAQIKVCCDWGSADVTMKDFGHAVEVHCRTVTTGKTSSRMPLLLRSLCTRQ